MEVAKRIITREKGHILGVAEKVGNQFHQFGGKDPDQQVCRCRWTRPCGLAEIINECKVIEEGKIDKAGEVNGIYTSGLLAPDGTVCE